MGKQGSVSDKWPYLPLLISNLWSQGKRFVICGKLFLKMSVITLFMTHLNHNSAASATLGGTLWKKIIAVDLNFKNLKTPPEAAWPPALSFTIRLILISFSPSCQLFFHWIFFIVSIFLFGLKKQYLTTIVIKPSLWPNNDLLTFIKHIYFLNLEGLHGLYIFPRESNMPLRTHSSFKGWPLLYSSGQQESWKEF